MGRDHLIRILAVTALFACGAFVIFRGTGESLITPEANHGQAESGESYGAQQSREALSDSPFRSDGSTGVASNVVAECKQADPIDDQSWSEEKLREFDELQRRIMTRAVAKLSAATDAEHLIAASMLSVQWDSELAANHRQRARNLSPENRILAWHELLLCEAPTCNSTSVEDNAIRAASDNGAVWFVIASNRLARNENRAAVEAVRRAITAPVFDIYFIDQVLMFERAFSASTNWSYPERVFGGFSLAATHIPRFGSLTERCDHADPGSSEWVSLCDQLGATMMRDEQTIIVRSIGKALRRLAAEKNGDLVAAEKYAEDKFRVSATWLAEAEEKQNLLTNDEKVLRDFLENFESYGETEAQDRLSAEVVRLKAATDYDQCNFVRSLDNPDNILNESQLD